MGGFHRGATYEQILSALTPQLLQAVPDIDPTWRASVLNWKRSKRRMKRRFSTSSGTANWMKLRLRHALLSPAPWNTAMAQRPDPREYKEGTDTNDSLFQRPQTSQDCEAIVAAIQAKLDEFIQGVNKNKDRLGVVERGIERIQSRRPLYTSLQNQVQKGEIDDVAGHPEFSDDDAANQSLVTRVCRKLDDTERALHRTEEAMRRRFDKEMHPLITGERFAKRNIPFRERLVRLAFDDFALQAEQQIRAVEDQMTVCQAQLGAQEQEKRILVQKLDTLARQTANLFEQASAPFRQCSVWSKRSC